MFILISFYQKFLLSPFSSLKVFSIWLKMPLEKALKCLYFQHNILLLHIVALNLWLLYWKWNQRCWVGYLRLYLLKFCLKSISKVFCLFRKFTFFSSYFITAKARLHSKLKYLRVIVYEAVEQLSSFAPLRF